MVRRAKVTELSILANLGLLTLEFIAVPVFQPNVLSFGALGIHTLLTILTFVIYGVFSKKSTHSAYTFIKNDEPD